MTRSIFSHRPLAGAADGRRSLEWWLAVWGPVVVAVGVIAAESTTTFSGASTSGWLRPIFERVFGRFSDPIWYVLHHYLRKTGHFIGYGLVCLTFLRAWLHTLAGRVELSVARWRARACLYAVLSTAVVAACDEAHQATLPGRTGRWQDVLLDTCGASAMCLVVWVVLWRRGEGSS